MTDAPKPTAAERCAERLRELGRQDPILGVVDGRLALEGLLATLAERLEQLESDLGARIETTAKAVRDDLAEVAATLTEVRTRLAPALEPLVGPAPATADLAKLADLLSRDARTLGRRLRGRLLRGLDRAAPRHGLMPKLLADLDRRRRELLADIPESLVFVLPKRDAPALAPGTRLFDAVCEPAMAELCKSRWFIGLRYKRLKRRLHKQYRLLEIPVGDMAQEALLLRSELAGPAIVKRYQTTYDELSQRLADAWRGIRYNLESAAAELYDMAAMPETERAEATEKPADLAGSLLGALDGSLTMLDEVGTTYQTVLGGIQGEIKQDHDNARKAIRDGVAESETWRGRLRWARHSAQKAVLRRAYRWRDRAVALSGKARAYGERGYERLQHQMLAVRLKLGIADIAEETRLLLTDLPAVDELSDRVRQLPAIFRRLFSDEPLSNREFLVARDEELGTLSEVIGRWKNGRTSSVAIVGPEGSGKTSLINCFQNELDPHLTVGNIGLDRRLHSSEEVIALLALEFGIEQPAAGIGTFARQLLEVPKRLVVIEQGHHLLLRVVGGRAPIEAFFYLLMATRHHHLWVLSCRFSPWRRMQYMYNVEQYFTHIIETELHGQDELREALLIRQRATGVEPVFSDEGVRNYSLRKLRLDHPLDSPPVQKLLADDYFDRLFEFSGGDISAALYYWLLSLRHDKSGKITVTPLPRLDDRYIQSLDRTYLYTLAEVLGHGNLQVPEHSRIFRMEEQRSRLILEYLRHMRLVRASGEDDQGLARWYDISPVFYQPVHRSLRLLHMVY